MLTIHYRPNLKHNLIAFHIYIGIHHCYKKKKSKQIVLKMFWLQTFGLYCVLLALNFLDHLHRCLIVTHVFIKYLCK